MIDPVIFSIGGFTLRWYGVIVMIGVVVGSLIVERELRRRGENGDVIWDALVGWVSFGPEIKSVFGPFQLGLPLGVLPAGIVGARLWYVLNATLGGNRYYIENPSQIINIPQGGLHIFGGFLLGAIALLYFLRRNHLDPWLFLDAAGPAVLIGQGIGRIANFINQELYGPPTTLPWGIPISAEHRLPQFASLPEATRFHPTFFYELLWNVITASLLLWISRRYEKQIKPGTIFAGWLIAAGFGRTWLEIFFRPDQPKIPGTGISYSAIISALMAIAGAIMLLVRYKAIDLKWAKTWEEEYHVNGTTGTGVPSDQPVKAAESARVKRTPQKASTLQKKAKEKIAARKTKETSTRTARAKKSSE